jgi:hypothetical protein
MSTIRGHEGAVLWGVVCYLREALDSCPMRLCC